MVIVTHALESIFKTRNLHHARQDEKRIIANGDPRQLRDTSTDVRVKTFFNRSSQDHA